MQCPLSLFTISSTPKSRHAHQALLEAKQPVIKNNNGVKDLRERGWQYKVGRVRTGHGWKVPAIGSICVPRYHLETPILPDGCMYSTPVTTAFGQLSDSFWAPNFHDIRHTIKSTKQKHRLITENYIYVGTPKQD